MENFWIEHMRGNYSSTAEYNRNYYVVLAIFMAIITILGTAANIIALVKVTRNKKRVLLHVLLANICASDLISAFFGGGISTIATLNESFISGYWTCVFSGYTVAVAGISSLISITVIAVDRYFIVCRHRSVVGKWDAMNRGKVIGIIWSWSFFWNTPLIFIKDGYATEGLGTTCAPNYRSKNKFGLTWNYIYFITCFFVPCLVLVIYYFLIILRIQKASKFSENDEIRKISRRNIRATAMCAVMMCAFLGSWTPYAVISILATYFGIQSSVAVETIAVVCAKSSTVYNPMIYIGMNRQITKSSTKRKNYISIRSRGSVTRSRNILR